MALQMQPEIPTEFFYEDVILLYEKMMPGGPTAAPLAKPSVNS
jgi:hypothetical protein